MQRNYLVDRLERWLADLGDHNFARSIASKVAVVIASERNDNATAK